MATTKKLHWTQTPEGKVRVKEMLKKASAARRRKAGMIFPDEPKNGSTEHGRKEDPSDEQFIYALGRTQGWLEAYAAGTGRSVRSLAERVGTALLNDPGRASRRDSYPVRDL